MINRPYIIEYYSPSYVSVIQFQQIINKKKLSGSQIIGIVCGSVAAAFLIAYIIITIVRKRNKANDESYSSLVMYNLDSKSNSSLQKIANETNAQIHIPEEIKDDADNWL